jgi:hypothetical protein
MATHGSDPGDRTPRLLNLEAIGISADFWGQPDVVRNWLRTDYDPATMPPLTVARVGVDPTPWLLGWESPPGEDSLYFRIFGHPAQVEQMAAG